MLDPREVRAVLQGIGRKGGHARAAVLTPERRREIARRAARARHRRCMGCGAKPVDCACNVAEAPE